MDLNDGSAFHTDLALSDVEISPVLNFLRSS